MNVFKQRDHWLEQSHLSAQLAGTYWGLFSSLCNCCLLCVISRHLLQVSVFWVVTPCTYVAV